MSLGLVALVSGLAQTSSSGWVPFLRPMPVYHDTLWPWLLIPLSAGVAIVYKSIKCNNMSRVPREATTLAVWIIAGMALAGAALYVIVAAISRFNV